MNNNTQQSRVGQRVTYSGWKTPQTGTIKAMRGNRLIIQFDGQPIPHHAPFHPTWKIKYHK